MFWLSGFRRHGVEKRVASISKFSKVSIVKLLMLA
jgi:hypothetical protein